MDNIKRFFIWFFVTLIIGLFAYGLIAVLFYLFEQSWGLIALIVLAAFFIGITGALKGDN